MQLAGLGGTGGSDNKFLYNGKELEDEHNLYWYHYGARFYDPQLGKWHSIDPADEFYSPYVYVGNRPTIAVDPDGSNTYKINDDGSVSVQKFNFFRPSTWGELFSDRIEYLDGTQIAWDDAPLITRTLIQEKIVFQKLEEVISSGEVDAISSSILESPIFFYLSAGVSASTEAVTPFARYGFQTVKNIKELESVKGLYVFKDATRNFKPYFGMSEVSIASRLRAHNYAGRIGGQIYFKPLTGTRTVLEMQETLMINYFGGLRGTANLRLPVSLLRNQQLNLGITNYVK